MKHRINIGTGICSACGLSVTQKLTSSCYGSQLTSSAIKAITTGKINYHVMYGWFNPDDFMKPNPTSKPTYKVVSADELPPEVKEAITQIMGDFGFTKAKPTTEELAAGIAEVFSEAFKTNESPDFSDDELELLQQIKDNLISVSYVTNFGLSKPNMDRLRTLIKYGAVRVWENYYQVTAYGERFLSKPEQEIEPTLLSISEISFLFCCARKPWYSHEMARDREAVAQFKELEKRGLVVIDERIVRLTTLGLDHIAKLCAIPL